MSLTIDSVNLFSSSSGSFVASMEANASKFGADDEVNEIALKQLSELAVFLASLGSKAEFKELLAEIVISPPEEKRQRVSTQHKLACVGGKNDIFWNGTFPSS